MIAHVPKTGRRSLPGLRERAHQIHGERTAWMGGAAARVSVSARQERVSDFDLLLMAMMRLVAVVGRGNIWTW